MSQFDTFHLGINGSRLLRFFVVGEVASEAVYPLSKKKKRAMAPGLPFGRSVRVRLLIPQFSLDMCSLLGAVV